MNCPECGRIMLLLFATEIGKDSTESAFWWVCSATNDFGGCWAAENTDKSAIPAPEYDWLWWAADIPQEDLATDSELQAEVNQLRQAYRDRPFPGRKYPTDWNGSILIVRSE